LRSSKISNFVASAPYAVLNSYSSMLSPLWFWWNFRLLGSFFRPCLFSKFTTLSRAFFLQPLLVGAWPLSHFIFNCVGFLRSCALDSPFPGDFFLSGDPYFVDGVLKYHGHPFSKASNFDLRIWIPSWNFFCVEVLLSHAMPFHFSALPTPTFLFFIVFVLIRFLPSVIKPQSSF